MPELPEVQTIIDDLKKEIRGWKVADFCSDWERNVSGGVAGLKNRILGKKILDVERKGKYIVFVLSGGGKIVVHLRMTGALLVKSEKLKVKSIDYIRHFWVLKKSRKVKHLLFSDVRKFGTIEFFDGEIAVGKSGFCKLGVDPLSEEFSAEKLEKIIDGNRNSIVKNLLLDQCKIAGIGNIYACEILFDARIKPSRRTGSLSETEIVMLQKSTKRILRNAIKWRGTTFSDYRDSRGKRGSFQNKLKVYNRKSDKCKRSGCEGVIQKETIGQRSTFFCPNCQK